MFIKLQGIIKVWWPLAMSWLIMSAEFPLISAFVSRMENPEISLAAYGGIIHPIVVFIGAPIIVFLPASTALSKNWESYKKLQTYMIYAVISLTLLHSLVAFTPLYNFIVLKIIKAPVDIIDAGKIGLMIMTSWIASVAIKRFNQGILIRLGYTQGVTIGTIIRFLTITTLLIFLSLYENMNGVISMTLSVATGLFAEALFTTFAIKPIVKNKMKRAEQLQDVLTRDQFLKFYLPLAMTSILLLIVQPIVISALTRMPDPLNSLAVWPVVFGLVYILRSGGVAVTEVTVACLEEPNAIFNLKRFIILLSIILTLITLLIAVTPFSRIWFVEIQGLRPILGKLASYSFLLAIPLPALTVLQGFYQGLLIFAGRTRGMFESVIVYLLSLFAVLIPGIILGQWPGIILGVLAITIAGFTQVIWLFFRSIPILRLQVSKE